jgi:hypothetical protein
VGAAPSRTYIVSVSRSIRIALALIVFLAGSVAWAMELGRAEGSVLIAGSVVPIRFAYGRYAPSIRPGASQDVLILLTSRPLAPATLASDTKASKMTSRGEIVTVEVRLDERFQHVRTVIRGKTPATLAGDAVEIRPAVASRHLIDATISRRGSENVLKITFRTLIGDESGFAPNAAAAAALNEPPAAQEQVRKAVNQQLDAPNPVVIPGGTPLPPDGGEPGRVYVAYEDALRADDIARAKKLMSSRSAGRFEMMKQIGIPLSTAARANIQVVSGSVQGDKAIVNVTGTVHDSGMPSGGVVRLVKENGEWKVIGEQWQASAADVMAASGALERSKMAPLTGGSPLPADGGEPGSVWRAYDRALVKEDRQALKKLVSSAEAASMDRFPNEVMRFKEFRPTNVHVVGGVTNGSKTTLRLAGTPAYPTASDKGMITLVKENGLWKIAAGEDWSQAPLVK